MRFILFLIGLSMPLCIWAQKKITISGTIKDAISGEHLIGANIRVLNPKMSIQSNVYGFYSLSIPQNEVEITCSYVGYQSFEERFNISKDTTINIFLKTQDTLSVLEVIADKDKNIRTTQSSVLNIPIQQLSNVPNMIGEKDLLKSLQLLPGIQFGQEGTSGLLVRGGSPDQNLILLDDVPMYNVSHLYGFFSVFNTDAIKSVDVYKGGFPARHGGRLSSVIDIRTKDGNMSKWQGSMNVGVLAANGSIEGPIIKNKLSIFLSARRSILDLWTSLTPKPLESKESNSSWGYYFYDLNLKTNYIIDDKNKIYLSIYKGRDLNTLKSNTNKQKDSFDIKQNNINSSGWGNFMTSLKWNKIYNNSLFSNYTAAVIDYNYNTGNSVSSLTNNINTQSRYEYNSSIKDFLTKQDFEYFSNNKSTIRFGVSQSFKIFKPGVEITSIKQERNLDTTLSNPNVNTFNFALYYQNELEFSEKLTLNAGLRYDFIHVKGFQGHYIQPRLSLRYLINNSLSLKSSFSNVVQDLHLLTNSTSGLPTDLWLPATNNVKPEQSSQITLGIFKNFDKKSWETSLEGYYKTFKGIVEYKEGASFLNTFTSWDDKVETGKGESYGLELFIHKKEGKVNGWVSYTLSYNDRTFQNINQGRTFPFRYDRRHYLNIFINKTFREGKRSVSTAFVFATGNPVSMPTDKYAVSPQIWSQYYVFTNFIDQESYSFGNQVFNYPQRNNYRLRAYNRLDLMYNYIKTRKHYTRTFSIGVYNLLFYRNPYFLIVKDDDMANIYALGVKREVKVQEVSLFNFIPAINLNYKFF